MGKAMKPFVIVNWGFAHKQLGFTKSVEGITNYELPKGSYLEGESIWEVAQFIYKNGLNVMIKHNDESDMLAVEKGVHRFHIQCNIGAENAEDLTFSSPWEIDEQMDN